jgi:hypothetical protein
MPEAGEEKRCPERKKEMRKAVIILTLRIKELLIINSPGHVLKSDVSLLFHFSYHFVKSYLMAYSVRSFFFLSPG